MPSELSPKQGDDDDDGNGDNQQVYSVSYDDDELDSFLTTIESKLRGPFSSLDLAKAVSTMALRSSAETAAAAAVAAVASKGSASIDSSTLAAKEYLHKLSCVVSRTDKVIQCRMLIGLLGLQDNESKKQSHSDDATTSSSSLTPEIIRILEDTQVGPLHEEWVRTTSGLIQGIMFQPSPPTTTTNTRESCRGKEADKIINNEVTAICQKVVNPIRKESKQDDPSDMMMQIQPRPDLNACFAPYRYSLISTPVLNTIIPEFQVMKHIQDATDETNATNENSLQTAMIGNYNCHFQINTQADILQVDYRLEDQKAKEEEEHAGISAAGLSGVAGIHQKDLEQVVGGTSEDSNGNKPNDTLPPGFRPTKLVKKSGPSAGASNNGSKSNMFMPKSKPSAAMTSKAGSSSLFNASNKQRPGTGKAMLRRKGGAQALVSRSNLKQRTAAAAAAGTAGVMRGTPGKAIPGSRTAVPSSSGTMPMVGGGAAAVTSRLAGRGRAAMAASSGRSKMKMIDVTEVDALTKQRQAEEASINATDNRATKRKRILDAAQQKGIATRPAFKKTKQEDDAKSGPAASEGNQPVGNGSAAAATAAAAPPSQLQQADWQLLLHDRSNKMSEEDKIRVQQFFEQKYNPTPDQVIYKMKIHEQRGQDPETGKDIKETFYLELDYNSFTSKQSKKVKRY